MTALKNISLSAAIGGSFVFGFWLYQPKQPIDLTDETDIIQDSDTPVHYEYTPPSFDFDLPFDARKELTRALSVSDVTERYGRMIAIGYHAAQHDPEANLATLSPEIWQYAHYDLRGAFQAEWMRNAPLEYLAWAEPKFKELEKEGTLNLFPTYHLAYMEPRAVLELLPAVGNPALKNRLRRELLSTLVELDPALLWERREEIAEATAIVSEAAIKGHYQLALQFWEASGWEDHFVIDGLLTHIAQNQFMEAAAHLKNYQRTRFAAIYAAEHPQEAAAWVRTQPSLPELEYSFGGEHAAFFARLFAIETFPSWADAPLWICEALNADEDNQSTATLFSAIKSNVEACRNTRLRQRFGDYLLEVEDSEIIKQLYLSLEAKHPILEILERFMLNTGADYTDAIVKRTTQEAPTPERLMKVLELGNLDTWPEEYRSAASSAVDSLSDDELLWSLSPSMVLSLQEIAPDRIHRIMSTADPLWVNSTLKNFGFIKNVSLGQFDSIPTLTQDLPEEDAQSILETARASLLQRALFDENKVDYLRIAQTPIEVMQVAAGIQAIAYESNPELRQAIEANPYREDIYLTIASSYSETETTDPNIQRANERIKQGRALLNQSLSAVVSSMQSLPEGERLLVAKAALLADEPFSNANNIQRIIKLPFWDDEQRSQLQGLGFKHYINDSLEHEIDFIW